MLNFIKNVKDNAVNAATNHKILLGSTIAFNTALTLAGMYVKGADFTSPFAYTAYGLNASLFTVSTIAVVSAAKFGLDATMRAAKWGFDKVKAHLQTKEPKQNELRHFINLEALFSNKPNPNEEMPELVDPVRQPRVTELASDPTIILGWHPEVEPVIEQQPKAPAKRRGISNRELRGLGLKK